MKPSVILILIPIFLVISCHSNTNPRQPEGQQTKTYFQLQNEEVENSNLTGLKALDAKHGFKNIKLGSHLSDFNFDPEEWDIESRTEAVNIHLVYYKPDSQGNPSFQINGSLIDKVELVFFDSILYVVEVEFVMTEDSEKVYQALVSIYEEPKIRKEEVTEFWYGYGYTMAKNSLNISYYPEPSSLKSKYKPRPDLDSLINNDNELAQYLRVRREGRNVSYSSNSINVWVGDSTVLDHLELDEFVRFNEKNKNNVVVEKYSRSEYIETIRISKKGADKVTIRLSDIYNNYQRKLQDTERKKRLKEEAGKL